MLCPAELRRRRSAVMLFKTPVLPLLPDSGQFSADFSVPVLVFCLVGACAPDLSTSGTVCLGPAENNDSFTH